MVMHDSSHNQFMKQNVHLLIVKGSKVLICKIDICF